MAIKVSDNIREFITIPMALNRHFLYVNQELEVEITPTLDFEPSGYRIKVPSRLIELRLVMVDDYIHVVVYYNQGIVEHFQLHSSDAKQRKVNVDKLINRIEKVEYI